MTQKSDTARAGIIRAARKVLSRIGVANMTLQSVADAASISKGALYYYYKTKDDILYDIMEQDNVHSRRIAGRLAKYRSEHGVRDLKIEIAKGILNRFNRLDNNKLNLYLQGEALQGNTELRKKYKVKYHEWIKNIDKILSQLYGVQSSEITLTFSTLILAAVEGICIQKAMMDDIEADEDFIGRLLMYVQSLNFNKVVEYIKNNPDFSLNKNQ